MEDPPEFEEEKKTGNSICSQCSPLFSIQYVLMIQALQSVHKLDRNVWVPVKLRVDSYYLQRSWQSIGILLSKLSQSSPGSCSCTFVKWHISQYWSVFKAKFQPCVNLTFLVIIYTVPPKLFGLNSNVLTKIPQKILSSLNQINGDLGTQKFQKFLHFIF